jgi:cellulose synthase/poly-beta-1,6-N-acetylglucosamine synthase-like glycosyltransferase
VSLFFLTLIGLLALYAVLLGILWLGFRRVVRHQHEREGNPQLSELPTVSIVVAARNEQQNLPALFPALLAQDYPLDKLEIVLVDDRSEDQTWNILSDAAAQYPRVKALRIANRLPDYAPKKRALDAGIRAATGEIILLTDADCLPPPTWTRAMVHYYRDDIDAVAGYSPYVFRPQTPQFLRGMLSLDCFAFAAVAAASAGWGQPLTPTGTNLSYRRQTYLAVGGFEPIKQWVSGDDDLFIRHLAERTNTRVAYALDPRAYVPTRAPASWRQFWHQRVRFGSKGRHHRPSITLGIVAVYLLNIGIAVGAILAPAFFPSLFVSLLSVWGVKSVMELLFLASAARAFGETSLLKYFLPTAIVHPFYIALFGLLGLFGSYRWKEDSAVLTPP